MATYDGGQTLNAISCTTSLCVAVNDAGHALSSTNADAALPAWSFSTIDPGHTLVSISCASTGLCAAGDDNRGAVAGAVPAPAVTTFAPRFTGSTAADLSGTVNPNGATLSDCHFNFGTGVRRGDRTQASAVLPLHPGRGQRER